MATNTKSSYVVKSKRKEAMDAFDSLPRELRVALANASSNFSSIRAAEFLALDMKKRKERFFLIRPELQNILRPYLKKVM